MSWKDLDIKLKAELIKLGILSGITDKNKIIQMYDLSVGLPTLVRKFEEGGLINTTLEEEEQTTGLDRLIQDYQVQDPTVLFGIKTLEDSYKVSEAIRKYLLAKLAVEKEEEDIIKNDVESFINKNTFASPKPAVVPIMSSGTLSSQNSNEVLKLLETTLLLLQEDIKNENNSNVENKLNKDVIIEEGLLFNWNKDSYLKKNSWELVTEIAKPNIEEYQKSVQEKLKKQKELEEQQRKIQELIRLDSIQKNVLDSLTKELKPNTVEALSNPVEVDKNTIQEIQDIITPKLEKGTSEYYADSTAKHINRVLDEHFLQNPTLYSLLTDNFNFNKIQESFIHKDVNKESHRQPTDNSYIKGRQPLEHQHRAIIIHSSAGTPNGDLKSLTGKERSRDPNTRELLYNKDRTPKFRLAGAHFYISKDGKIYLLVGEDKVAFHSSVGLMFDAVDPNSFAFGIELEGYSYEEGKSNEHKNTDFSKNPKLLESLGKVIAYLCNKYNIPYELIQTHYDVDDYYELNFYKNLGFLKGIEGRKDLHGIEWKPPRGKVDIMPKQYAPIKNYLETYVFKKINNEHAYGGYINNQQPVLFRLFKNGGYKNKPPFEEWYKTVPVDRNDTTYYNLRKAYEELPFELLEKWRTATLEQLNNEKYHLPTVSPQSLEFLKSRNHPSIQYELDWYNSTEGKDFREKHSLDTTGDYYRYIPKAVGSYINKYNTGGWKEKLLGLGNYAKNYIKAKAGMIQPMFMNLNDYNVLQITKDNVSDNTLGILTNDFVEQNDDNEQRLAIDFKNTTDIKLGDHEIPLENISTYYGVEEGKLKVGPIEIFNDSTMVVPNRAKNIGKVKKVLYRPQELTEDSLLPLYGITVDNDTVPFPIRMRGKMYLGNEQGNSAFVSGITDPKVFNDVNKFLELNPSYPAMVDNGRFSHFILGNDLNSYIGIENPDDMYMLGITPKRKGGYISSNPTLAFSHKFGGGGFPDGKPTLTQNDLDKKVSKTYFENFPNLLEVYGTPRYNGEEKEMIENGDITGALESRKIRGEEKVKEVKSLLNNLTLLDSMFYTPILQRVDNIFEKTYNPDEEVSTMHRVSEGKVLGRLKDALQYYPVEEFKKKHQYILNKLLEVSDEDIYKFMTTNWGMDTVLDIMNIKPKNLSLAELLIIATTIHGMKSPYAPFRLKHGGYIFPKGVFLHKFDDGGYSNTTVTSTIEDKPKVVQKGKVKWNPLNVFNRNYKGAPIYESENFGDSFRLARIDEVPVFIWDGKAYNTNLKPNPLVEAARAWDTQGDLRKIEFQKRIISDPEGTMEYFRKTFPKGEYKTMNSNWDKDIYIIDDMYKNGALGMPNNVIVKGAKHNIGDLLWDYLNTTNLTYNQKLALMANSYKESMGWTTTKQTNGPAKGYYQMENAQFKNYQNWLKQNKLEDNIINETKYIIDLFENHRDKLITPISANLDIEDVINNYKDEEEAHANNHRSAYVHRGYYTEDALRDWDEGDLDAAVKAMEALFEKAGKPRLEDRQKIAWLLSEMYK